MALGPAYPGVDLFPSTAADGAYPAYGGEVPPAVTTGAASDIEARTATLNGLVDPNTLASHFYFQYGLTTNYGGLTSPGYAGSGDVDVAVQSYISGLTPAHYYHFRLVAYSAGGTTYGTDVMFFTDYSFGTHDPRIDWIHMAGKGQ